MKSSVLKIVLSIVVLGLSYWLYRVIQAPIQFNKKHNMRKERVIETMLHIRSAQLAYKTATGEYSDNFDELLSFADTGSILIVQQRDSSFERMNQVYQIPEIVDTVIMDTLGRIGVRDSLFKEIEVHNLRYIPYAKKGTEFELDAGEITKEGGLKVHVFELIARKDEWLRGMDKALISTNADDLVIGSMQEASISGNWQ
jgi:hypothetical protein